MNDQDPITPAEAGSPWAAPAPHTRAADWRYPAPSGHPGSAPHRHRRGGKARLVVGALAIAGLAASVGYIANGHDSSPSQAVTVPSTNPAMRNPATTSPSTNSNGNGTSPTVPFPGFGQGNGSGNGSSNGSTATNGNGTTSAPSTFDRGVVDINTRLSYQQAAAAGTGMIMDSSGYVLTNNHVVDGATSITVTVISTGKTYKATVVGTSPTSDVAVIKLQDASGLEPANFGDATKVQVGDSVTAVGNAGGVGGEPSASSGQVTSLDQQITASDEGGGNAEKLSGLIEVNANLQPGDSGGPLYDANGAVIGMNTAGSAARRYQVGAADGFAIPINTALDIAHQIQAGKASSTITIGTPGFLGVEVQGDDQSGQATTSGAVVADVVSGTPADSLGLQAGDVIRSVDGKAITSSQSLGDALSTHHGGDKVAIQWTDANGTSHSATVTLATGPAN